MKDSDLSTTYGKLELGIFFMFFLGKLSSIDLGS